MNGPERQTHPFNPQTSSPRLRPKAGDDAARPRASAVPKNHQNAPPTDAETSRRCIMQASYPCEAARLKNQSPTPEVGLRGGRVSARGHRCPIGTALAQFRCDDRQIVRILRRGEVGDVAVDKELAGRVFCHDGLRNLAAIAPHWHKRTSVAVSRVALTCKWR